MSLSYVELHAHSYYSLLDGVSSPRELVARAAHLARPLQAADEDVSEGWWLQRTCD